MTCRKWTHIQYSKRKKVTLVLVEGFVRKKCKIVMRNEMSVERLNDGVETDEGFCCLGNALNASVGYEITIVARTRIG